MKKCNKCRIDKTDIEFAKNKNTPSGLGAHCRICMKQWYQENKETILQDDKQYYQKNKEKILQDNKQYYQRNKEKIAKREKQYRQEHKEEKAKYSKQHYQENKKEIAELRKQHYQENKKEIAEIGKKYYQAHRREKIERGTLNAKKRRRHDVQFYLACKLRSRLYGALKNNRKVGSAVRDLGCTIPELVTHLENQFTKGMSWKNRGKWHVDHIIPISSFDLTDRQQFLKACNWKNLQPLWAIDNLKKGNRQ
jgi:hypothetical protein